MKALTLWQPFAELICLGMKHLETRSWAPPESMLGERLAVHAAKKEPDIGAHADLVAPAMRLLPHGDPLPLGAVVATCKLADAFQVAEVVPWFGGRSDRTFVAGQSLNDFEWVHGREVWTDTGDYALGRWMWILDEIEVLPEPIPATGRQGLWEWNQ